MLQDQIQNEPARAVSEESRVPLEERAVDEGPIEEAGW